MFFIDWGVLRLAVGGGGGGEDKVRYAVFHHSVHQGQAGHAVVAEILLRHVHAFAHQGEGCKVDHRFNVFPAKHVFQKYPVTHIAHIEASAFEGLTVAFGQVVHRHSVDAAGNEGGHAVAADVAGAAGHKNRHRIGSPFVL